MDRRPRRGPISRLIALIAIVAVLGGAWLAQAPSPASAGFVCDPGMNCAALKFITTGLGAGQIAGPGISCRLDGNHQSDDCVELYNFTPDYWIVELTILAYEGSSYLTTTGKRIPAGQPWKENVLLLPSNGDDTFQEVRFDLEGQTLELVLKGAGSGSVRHTDDGVVCPPTCTIEFDYGEGILIVADPAPGSFFKSWTGPCAGQDRTCEIDMPKSTTMDVTFGLTPVATATPHPATPKPTSAPAPTSPPAPTDAPSLPPPSSAPSFVPIVSAGLPSPSATGSVSPVASAIASPTAGPIVPTSTDDGSGSVLLIGLLLAAIGAGVGGFLFWRRRAASG